MISNAIAVHAIDAHDRFIVRTRVAAGLSQQVLRTDVAGMPLEWIDYKEAARLYHMGQVAYACGSTLYSLFGGTNARSGLRTRVEVNSIVTFLKTLTGEIPAGYIRAPALPKSTAQTPKPDETD